MKRCAAWILSIMLTMTLTAGCFQTVYAAESGTDFSAAGHNYRLVISDCTWTQALQQAKDAGGRLATFESWDEFDAVTARISQASLSRILFRIGGRRDMYSSQYFWIDGNNDLVGDVLNNPSSWAYNVWMKGEPSFQDGSIQEGVMDLFYYQDEGRWVFNDVPDDIISVVPGYSGKLGYIIEFDDAQTVQVSSGRWQDAYYFFISEKKYLEDVRLHYGDSLDGSMENISFALRDMNGDGTPELIIFNGDSVYAGSVCYLYQFKDGSVQYVGMMAGSNYNPYMCVDELSLPGLFASGAHTGAYWTDYYSFDGVTLQTENVWAGTDLEYDSVTGENVLNTDPQTGEVVTKESSRTENETLYQGYVLIQNGEGGTPLTFSTQNEISQMGWETWLTKYGYTAGDAGSSAAGTDGSVASAGAGTTTSVDPSVILSSVPDSFYFSSGVGAWDTGITLNDDGTFSGSYHDSNMGEDTENYPGGTIYVCTFVGNFTDFQKIDDYTWSMRLGSLEYLNPVGDDWTDGEVHYIASDAYGIAGGDLFYLYLPGHPIDTLPEEYMSWARMYMGYEESPTLTIYGIYNVAGEDGWGGNF